MSRYKIKRYIVGTKNKEKEIRKVMNHFERKERYMEHDLKREIMVIDSENENHIYKEYSCRYCDLSYTVESYIENGEPVGSKHLASAGNMSLSPATIRNEMSELEEMGYLDKPHTSAGRIPSNAA